MATTFDPNANFTNLMTELRNVGQQGNYNVPMKLPAPVVKERPYVAPTALYTPSGTGAQGGGVGSSQGNTGTLDGLLRALRSQESSGNYRATNSQSGAAGGYQMLPTNVAQWSKELLGHTVGLNEFMNSPQLQDQIARYKLGQYVKKFGSNAAAAVAWYGGEGAVKNMYSKTTQKGGYPSLYAYWNSVLKKMG